MAIFRKGNPLRTQKGLQYSNFGNGGGGEDNISAMLFFTDFYTTGVDLISLFVDNDYVYTRLQESATKTYINMYDKNTFELLSSKEGYGKSCISNDNYFLSFAGQADSYFHYCPKDLTGSVLTTYGGVSNFYIELDYLFRITKNDKGVINNNFYVLGQDSGNQTRNIIKINNSDLYSAPASFSATKKQYITANDYYQAKLYSVGNYLYYIDGANITKFDENLNVIASRQLSITATGLYKHWVDTNYISVISSNAKISIYNTSDFSPHKEISTSNAKFIVSNGTNVVWQTTNSAGYLIIYVMNLSDLSIRKYTIYTSSLFGGSFLYLANYDNDKIYLTFRSNVNYYIAGFMAINDNLKVGTYRNGDFYVSVNNETLTLGTPSSPSTPSISFTSTTETFSKMTNQTLSSGKSPIKIII